MAAGRMTLDKAGIGGRYRVEDMQLPTAVEKRLEALGMTHGALIEVLNGKGKGTVIVRVRGTRFALGRALSSGISVSAEAESGALASVEGAVR